MLWSIKKILTILSIFLLGVIALSLIWIVPDSITGDTLVANTSAQWTVSPQKSFVLPEHDVPSWIEQDSRKAVRSRHPDILLWESWNGDDASTGQLVSPAFAAPSVLRLYVSGYIADPSLRKQILLKRLDTAETLRLNLQYPGESWIPVDWSLPKTWRGESIQLIATDQAQGMGGWIGVSSPIQLSWLSLLRSQMAALLIFPTALLHFVGLLLPGILITLWWQQKFPLPRYFLLMLSMTFTGLLGYFTFIAYWIAPIVGKVLSIGILVASVIWGLFLCKQHRRVWHQALTTPDLCWPIVLWGLVVCFYLSVLLIPAEPYEPFSLITYRFFGTSIATGMPPDNIIPKLFAERLHSGRGLRAPLFADWLASDRPPLQTGLLLLQFPILIRGTYQTLGTILQCTWIPAFWALGYALRWPRRQLAVGLFFAIFSGFFLFNSLFLWPKLLGAAFVLFVFAIFYEAIREQRATTVSEIIVVAIATTLALLAHGSVVFTLIPMFFILFAHPGNYRRLARLSVVGGLIILLLLSPWGAYQKFFNPPGNRLAKWYLAGVETIDQRSTLEAIGDSYRQLSFADFLANKQANARMLFNPDLTLLPAGTRNNNFFHVFNSLGFLNLGWLLLLIPALRRRLRQSQLSRGVFLLLSVGLASLGVWILLVFGPGLTVIHAGSYATMTLLFMGLSCVLSLLPNLVLLGLIALQFVHFAITWIVTTPSIDPAVFGAVPNFWMIGLTVVSVFVLMATLRRLGKTAPPESPNGQAI